MEIDPNLTTPQEIKESSVAVGRDGNVIVPSDDSNYADTAMPEGLMPGIDVEEPLGVDVQDTPVNEGDIQEAAHGPKSRDQLADELLFQNIGENKENLRNYGRRSAVKIARTAMRMRNSGHFTNEELQTALSVVGERARHFDVRPNEITANGQRLLEHVKRLSVAPTTDDDEFPEMDVQTRRAGPSAW